MIGTKKTNEAKNGGSTELVFVLDRSGSMAGLESDTVGGFNGMLNKQRGNDAPCWVTTVLFDHERVTLHDRLPLRNVEALTSRDYQVRGSTALFDAIGETVRHIENVHRYIRPEDVPQTTLFVVITDGLENASRSWTRHAVRRLLDQKQEEGWEFIFIGANIDAVEAASDIGIRADRAVNYRADSRGTAAVYRSVSCAVDEARACMPMSSGWRSDVDADFSARSGKDRRKKK